MLANDEKLNQKAIEHLMKFGPSSVGIISRNIDIHHSLAITLVVDIYIYICMCIYTRPHIFPHEQVLASTSRQVDIFISVDNK